MLCSRGLVLSLAVVAAGCAEEHAAESTLVPVPAGSVPPGPGVPPPFAVSDQFIPGGFMGDLEPTGVLDIDGGSCPLPRPEGAQGECYTFTIQPLPGFPGAEGWGGLLWQYPLHNWGAEPGRLISPGAREVSFYAGGAKGGEVVTFKVGGTDDPALPHADTLDLEYPVTLGTGPLQHHTISLVDVAYSEVISGFGWVMDVPTDSDEPIIFYVDDLRWR